MDENLEIEKSDEVIEEIAVKHGDTNDPETVEMIKEISVKHGVSIGRDDPIMILPTMNNWLIHKLVENNKQLMNEANINQKKILEEFESHFAGLLLVWKTEADGKASQTLNTALDAINQSKSDQENFKSDQENFLEKFKSEMDAGAKLWAKAAEEKSCQILNTALDASKKVIDDCVKKSVDAINNELIDEKLTAPLRRAKGVAILNLVAAVMVVASAGCVILVVKEIL